MTTQKAFASYDEVIDLHTESDTVSVIGIHTPTGNTPHRMFKGFFEQFKKYKYYGCSIKLVPAARLPADPLQVSYEAGEPTIDPRDLMNPLLFHGCHGNDLGQILNRLYTLGSDSDSINRMIAQFTVNSDPDLEQPLDGLELEQLYYKALTDKTWRKAHPQRGFYKAGLRPMIYSLATTHQILPDAPYGIGGFVPSKPEFDNVVGSITSDDFSADGMVDFVTRGQFITPRLTGLGWLDTKQVLLHAREDATAHFEGSDVVSDITEWLHGVEQASEEYMTLPSIFMGVILLPPAYKTEQYYRMIITHHFGFKGFRGISFSNDIVETPSYFNMNVDDYEYEPSPDPEPGPSPDPDPDPDPEPTPTPTVYDFTLDGVPYSTRLYTDASLTSYVDVYNYNIASSGDVAYPLPSENLKYAYQARLSNGNILNLNSDNVQINALVTPLTATGNNRVGAMLADGSIVFNGLVYARQTGSDGLTTAYFPTKGDASTVPIVFTNWDTAPFYGSGIGSTSVYSIEVLE